VTLTGNAVLAPGSDVPKRVGASTAEPDHPSYVTIGGGPTRQQGNHRALFGEKLGR
jgi:hypothetical protein